MIEFVVIFLTLMLGVCHVATKRVWHNKTTLAKTGEDLTRDLAVELAAVRWNERSGE